MNNSYNVLIVGGGLVGMYAASLAKDKGLNPLLIEATNKLGGQPASLYPKKLIFDLPTYDQITGEEIVKNAKNQLFKQLKQEDVLLNTSLISYEIKNNDIVCHLSNNKEIVVKYMIIATGNGLFEPILLEIPGTKNNKKVLYNISDPISIKNQQIVVLGGGDSAVDLANLLSQENHVSIIHRRDTFRATGNNVSLLYKNNVNTIMSASLIEIKDNTLTYKIPDKETNIKFDKLIVQYGQKFNTNLDIFKAINKSQLNQFIVNENMQTNFSNIFAIGNCCDYPNRPNLISLGFGEAAKAIMYIVSKEHVYPNL